MTRRVMTRNEALKRSLLDESKMLLDVPISHVVTTFGKPSLDDECNASWKVGRATVHYSGEELSVSGPDDAVRVVKDIIVKTPVSSTLVPGTAVKVRVYDDFLQGIFKNNIFIICHDKTLFSPQTLDTAWKIWSPNMVQLKLDGRVYEASFEILTVPLETIF